MSMFIVAYDLPTGNEQDKLFFKPIKKNLNEKGIGINQQEARIVADVSSFFR